MFTSIFVLVSSIVFGLLFVVWRKDDWANTFIKICLLGLTVWGLLESLRAFGFIVKL